MWFSVVCILIDNHMQHHRGQNIVDSGLLSGTGPKNITMESPSILNYNFSTLSTQNWSKHADALQKKRKSFVHKEQGACEEFYENILQGHSFSEDIMRDINDYHLRTFSWYRFAGCWLPSQLAGTNPYKVLTLLPF